MHLRAWQLGIIVCLLAAASVRAQDTGLVAIMAKNEFNAHKQDVHFSYIAEERSARTGGHLWRENVVETADGPLHRLLAVDGRPLGAAAAKAESARIAAIVANPAEFRRVNAAHRDDEAHAAELLGLLPKAFLLTFAGAQDGCTLFAFRPNPAFQPSTYEERAIHAMGGTVSLRQPEDRLCRLQATILQPVTFGFGLLGRIEQGGQFTLERIPVGTTSWKSSFISVHVEGRILMLKTLTREQEIRRTDIHVIPQNLSLGDAARLTSG